MYIMYEFLLYVFEVKIAKLEDPKWPSHVLITIH